jgi:hypothetical protein
MESVPIDHHAEFEKLLVFRSNFGLGRQRQILVLDGL